MASSGEEARLAERPMGVSVCKQSQLPMQTLAAQWKWRAPEKTPPRRLERLYFSWEREKEARNKFIRRLHRLAWDPPSRVHEYIGSSASPAEASAHYKLQTINYLVGRHCLELVRVDVAVGA